jgi:hypothetical protein
LLGFLPLKPECTIVNKSNVDAAFGEQILDITIAEVESMVEPNRVADDVGRKSVTLISIHQRIIDE